MKKLLHIFWNARKYYRMYNELKEHNIKNLGFLKFAELVNYADFIDTTRNDTRMIGLDGFIRASRIMAMRNILPGRRKGNSTRQIDFYIQLFFHLGEIRREWLMPHETDTVSGYQNSAYPKNDQQEYLMERIRRRLIHEHHMDKWRNLTVNNRNCIKVDTNVQKYN